MAVTDCNLTAVDVLHNDVVYEAMRQGYGIMITPNHPTHADAYNSSAGRPCPKATRCKLNTFRISKIGDSLDVDNR